MLDYLRNLIKNLIFKIDFWGTVYSRHHIFYAAQFYFILVLHCILGILYLVFSFNSFSSLKRAPVCYCSDKSV